MAARSIHAVTGAFGYSGRYIAQRLLSEGRTVITLTNSPARANPSGDRVRAVPFLFDVPDRLADSLRDVAVLYNTYWVRFNHPTFKQADAVTNTLALFSAAKKAGVERVVHVSITNPSDDSPLEYFRSKGMLEKGLVGSGLSYAILRPAVLFGKEDILINNIAWALRRRPIFGVFGDGSYRLQPIYVDDLAELAVTAGKSRENQIINAIGPETFTYRELVAVIGKVIGKRRPILSLPPRLAYAVGRLISWWQHDEMITWEEVKGLMGGLLFVDAPPTGKTRLTDWIREHSATLGQTYTSELARRRDRQSAYASN